MNNHRTTPAPNAKPAPLGLLGIGHPRLPIIEYFPGETVSEFIERASGLSANRRHVAGWLHHEEELT